MENDCRPLFPKGKSVNDGITSNLCSLQYARIDNAVEIISTMGPGTLLTNVDLQDAYRIFPVHSNDHNLLCIAWEDMTFVLMQNLIEKEIRCN